MEYRGSFFNIIVALIILTGMAVGIIASGSMPEMNFIVFNFSLVYVNILLAIYLEIVERK